MGKVNFIVYESTYEILITTPEKEDEMIKIWFPETVDGRNIEDFCRLKVNDAVEISIRAILKTK